MTRSENTRFCLINPKLLIDSGYKLMVYRLRSNSIFATANAMKETGVEAYTTLGQFDFICKHFGMKDTFQAVLDQNKVQWIDLRPWVVSDIDRHYFKTQFDYAPLLARGKTTIQNLKTAQDNWQALQPEVQHELIAGNYVLGSPITYREYVNGKPFKLFIFVSFSLDMLIDSSLTRKLNAILFPALEGEVSCVYWSRHYGSPQCLIECEGSDLPRLLDLATGLLHQEFQGGIQTESYMCVEPLFDRINIDLSDIILPQEVEPQRRITSLGQYLEQYKFKYEKIESLIEHEGYSVNKGPPEPSAMLEALIFFNRFQKDYEEILICESDSPNLVRDARKAMAAMLVGVLKTDSVFLNNGTLDLSPWVEKIVRRLLAAAAYSHLKDWSLVQGTLRLSSVTKGHFPDRLNAAEVAEKIILWNDTYPDVPILEPQTLEDLRKFREIRNAIAHGHPVDFHTVKEFAPRAFTVITRSLRRCYGLPKNFHFKIDG